MKEKYVLVNKKNFEIFVSSLVVLFLILMTLTMVLGVNLFLALQENDNLKTKNIKMINNMSDTKKFIYDTSGDSDNIIEYKTNLLSAQEAKVETEKEETIKEENKIYLGKFKITHYCACKKCCGPNAQGITASGKKVEEGKTIAVDPKVIKLGSKVHIEGYGDMEAQDTGSAIKGNIIDIYIANHNEALKLGVKYKDVYLVK